MGKGNWIYFSYATFQDGISLREETEGSKPDSTSRDHETVAPEAPDASEPKATSSHEDVVSGMLL